MEGRRCILRPGRICASGGLLVGLVAILSGALAALAPGAAAQAVRTAELTQDRALAAEAALPEVLSLADAARYRRIFAAQTAGHWAAADRDIAFLDDRLLLGAVEAQRYLHPAYRASYGELQRWLARHGAEGDAKAIYALALRRQPSGAPPPEKPGLKPLLPRGRRDAAASALDGAEPPGSDWPAGLAAWRRGRLADARRHFEALARTSALPGGARATAAFWAARVALRDGRPDDFTRWLTLAAQYPRTFYGLLARDALGIDGDDDFADDVLRRDDVELVLGSAGGRRALALLQTGERARAEAELRALASRASPDLVTALVAIADRANMPALSLLLAGVLAEGELRHDHALYPVPRWEPFGGFIIDRALIFAVMRQESQFLPEVESRAGAVGVMQLMPATAEAMARRAGLWIGARGGPSLREALADPEINMTLAQEYIADLMENGHIGGNLLLLALAYNCGPGALQRWQEAAGEDDPLLFLERIPSREARIFAERVLANYWIYRRRLGQPTPDLDALAAGDWPIYTALDPPSERERRHAAYR